MAVPMTSATAQARAARAALQPMRVRNPAPLIIHSLSGSGGCGIGSGGGGDGGICGIVAWG